MIKQAKFVIKRIDFNFNLRPMKHNYFFKAILFFGMLIYASLLPVEVAAKNSFVYAQTEKIELDSITPKSKVNDTIVNTPAASKKGNSIKTTTPKKKFFGKVYSYGLPPADEAAACEVGVFTEFYLFGVKLFKPKPVMTPLEGKEEILSQEVVACGEEYVPKKAEKEKSASRKSKKNKKINEEVVVDKGKKRYDSTFTIPTEE